MSSGGTIGASCPYDGGQRVTDVVDTLPCTRLARRRYNITNLQYRHNPSYQEQ